MTDPPLPPRSWVERAARAGYAAKGVVYLLIGVLAMQAAAGTGGRTTGARGYSMSSCASRSAAGCWHWWP